MRSFRPVIRHRAWRMWHVLVDAVSEPLATSRPNRRSVCSQCLTEMRAAAPPLAARRPCPRTASPPRRHGTRRRVRQQLRFLKRSMASRFASTRGRCRRRRCRIAANMPPGATRRAASAIAPGPVLDPELAGDDVERISGEGRAGRPPRRNALPGDACALDDAANEPSRAETAKATRPARLLPRTAERRARRRRCRRRPSSSVRRPPRLRQCRIEQVGPEAFEHRVLRTAVALAQAPSTLPVPPSVAPGVLASVRMSAHRRESLRALPEKTVCCCRFRKVLDNIPRWVNTVRARAEDTAILHDLYDDVLATHALFPPVRQDVSMPRLTSSAGAARQSIHRWADCAARGDDRHRRADASSASSML
jgi:hypothetical protein